MFATLLTALDVNGIELFLGTSVDDDGRPLKQGLTSTCERPQRERRVTMDRENNAAKHCNMLE